jgi:hypothetical protein
MVEGVAMINNDVPDNSFINESDLDKLVNLITKIKGLRIPANVEQLEEIIKLVGAHQELLLIGTSDGSHFMTMSDIEKMMVDLSRQLADTNLKALLETMNHLQGEDEIIAQKKKNIGTKE